MIDEPADKTIVCWFDPNGDLRAVFYRTDAYESGASRWYTADNGAGDGDPLEWWELLAEMDGFRGPIELTRSTS